MKDEEHHAFLFSVRRSIRYHLRRRQFFDRLNIWCKFLAALAGTATIVTILSRLGDGFPIAFAAAVTIFSVADLVIGSAQRSRAHEHLSRRFIQLETDITMLDSITDTDLRKFKAQRLAIEETEPPVKHILNMICHNELCRALGYDQSHQVKLCWYQRLLSQIVDIREYSVQLPQSC